MTKASQQLNCMEWVGVGGWWDGRVLWSNKCIWEPGFVWGRAAGFVLDLCCGFLLRSASDLWLFGVWTSCTVGVSGGSGVS